MNFRNNTQSKGSLPKNMYSINHVYKRSIAELIYCKRFLKKDGRICFYLPPGKDELGRGQREI